MPRPDRQQFLVLGPPCTPGQRSNRSGIVLSGDDVELTAHRYDATNDGRPDPCSVIDRVEDLHDPATADAKKYLWLITEEGLFLLPEFIHNPHNARGRPCHTNFFGSIPALQGGELWFVSADAIAINNRSGRYGSSKPEHWQAVKAYFLSVGYEKIIDLWMTLKP